MIKGLVVCIFFNLLTISILLAQIWPTDGPQTIGLNWGSNGGGLASSFHEGIDIEGIDHTNANFTQVKTSLPWGVIVQVDQDQNSFGFQKSIQILIRYGTGGYFDPPFRYIRYYHCEQININAHPSIFPFWLYSGQLIAGTNSSISQTISVTDKHIMLPLNSTFALLATSSDAGNVYCHLHLSETDLSNSINPLKPNLIGVSDVGSPAQSPVLGNLAIRYELSGVNPSPYFNHNPIWGSVDITREIYDPMGSSKTIAAESMASFSYLFQDCPTIEKEFANRSLVGAPAKIRFEIRDFNGISVWPQQQIAFTSVIASNLFDKLFDHQFLYFNQTINNNQYILTNIDNSSPYKIKEQHWNTRRSKTNSANALCILDAKYPDGTYTLHTEAEDMGINPISSDNIQVEVDNFKPFVQSVIVRAFSKNATTGLFDHFDYNISSSNWIWDGSALVLTPSMSAQRYLNDYARGTDKAIKIKIIFSEPMKNYSTGTMRVNLRSQCIGGHLSHSNSLILEEESIDQRAFTFILEDLNFDPHNEYQDIEIEAQDINGNSLMGFTEAATAPYGSYVGPAVNSSKICFIENGIWQNVNNFNSLDAINHFKVKGCFSNYFINGNNPIDATLSACLDAEFNATTTNVQINEVIQFNNLSTVINNATWHWDFGDGTSSILKDPTHSYLNPGLYTVTLTVDDGGTTIDKIKTDYISVSGSNSGGLISVSIDASMWTIDQGNTVIFSPLIVNPPSNVQYSWTFQGGNPSTSTDPNPEIYYTDHGPHQVDLSIIYNGQTIVAPSVVINVNTFVFPLNVQCNQLFLLHPRAGMPQLLTVDVFGGEPPYAINWDFGDGSTALTSSYYVDHTFANQGVQYTISIGVSDTNGRTGSCSYNITTVGLTGLSGDFIADQTSTSTHPASIVFTPCSLSNNQIQSFNWSFGDGTYTTSSSLFPSVTHIYTNSGTYSVQLSITDIFGESNTIFKQNFISIGTGMISLNPGFIVYDATLCNGETPIASGDAIGGIPRPNPGFDPISFVDEYYFYQWSAYTPGFSQNSSGNSFLSHPSHQSTYILRENLSPQPTYPYTFDLNLLVSDYATPHNSVQLHQTVTLYEDITIDMDDMTICPNGSKALRPVISGGTNERYYNYFWTATQGTLSCNNCPSPVFHFPNSTGQATITLLVSDSRYFCNPVQKVITVTVEPLSVTQLTINVCRDSHSQLIPSVTGGSGHYTYEWQPSTYLDCNHCPNPTFSPGQTGQLLFTLKVNDYSGCSISEIVTVNVSNNKPSIAPIEDGFTCPGKPVTLVSNITDGSGIYNYHWYKTYYANSTVSNSSNMTDGPMGTTVYTLTVTDNNGCTATQNAFIFVNKDLAPIVDAGPDREACFHTTDLTATASGGIQPYIYEWTNPDNSVFVGNPFICGNPTTTSNISVTVTDANGCKGIDDINLAHRGGCGSTQNGINPQWICLGSSSTIIPAISIPIINESSQNSSCYNQPYSYLWSPSTYLNDITIENPICTPQDLQPIMYCVEIRDSRGCWVPPFQAMITPFEQTKDPEIIFHQDDGCIGDEICFYVMANTRSFNGDDPTKLYLSVKVPLWPLDCISATETAMALNSDPTDELTFNPPPDEIIRTDNKFCVKYFTLGSKEITYNYTGPFDNSNNYPFYNVCNSFSKTYQFEIKNHLETDDKDVVKGNYFGSFLTDHKAITIWSPWEPNNCNPTFYSCYSATIQPPKLMEFYAKDEIVLFPGFEIYEGADLLAQINPCLVDYDHRFAIHHDSSNASQNIDNTLQESVEDYDEFKVYPNPTYDELNISINLNVEGEKMLILSDELGKIIQIIPLPNNAELLVKINFDELRLKQGVYSITLKSDIFIESKRISFIK